LAELLGSLAPQILADSDAFIHPLITSTMDKIRFSLVNVDAKQLAKRLDKIALETSSGPPFHGSGQYHAQGEKSAKSFFVSWIRARRDHMTRCDIAELAKRDFLPLVRRSAEIYLFSFARLTHFLRLHEQLSEDMGTTIWDTFPEVLLPTAPTLRLPLFDDNSQPETSPVRKSTTLFNTSSLLSEALRSCPSTAAARELLIDWTSRERQRHILNGEGWYLCLSPSKAETEQICGSRQVTWILDILEVTQEIRRIIEEVKTLFGLRAGSQTELQGLGRKRHGINSSTKPIVAQDGYPKDSTLGIGREAFKAMKINQNIVQHANIAAIMQGPKQSRPVQFSQTDTVGLNTPAHSDSTHHSPQCTSLLSLKSNEKPSEAPSIEPESAIPDIAGPAVASDIDFVCEEGAQVRLRQSEESTGAATNATSVLATRDSLSNGSHDSAFTTSKSLLGKRAERLAIVTKDLAERKLNSIGLPVDENHCTSAISLSSLPNNFPEAPANAFLVPRLPEGLGRQEYEVRIGGISSNKHGFTPLNNSPVIESQASSPERHPSRTIRSTLSRMDSSYFDSHQDRSRRSSHRLGNTTSGTTPPSGLSFIIPMFNQDCAVNSSVTAGQLEINLLRMIEAERQKCVASGVLWSHRQVCALTWVIENVQSLVSFLLSIFPLVWRLMPPVFRKVDDSQLHRVFERVLISLHETGSSPITPQSSSIAELAMRNSAHHELQSSGPSSSWGHAPLSSEISLDSAHMTTGRNNSTPITGSAPLCQCINTRIGRPFHCKHRLSSRIPPGTENKHYPSRVPQTAQHQMHLPSAAPP
jgi:hypothetical protein